MRHLLRYIQGYNTNFMIFKQIEIIPSMFTEYNGIKLEVSNRKIYNNTQIFEN